MLRCRKETIRRRRRRAFLRQNRSCIARNRLLISALLFGKDSPRCAQNRRREQFKKNFMAVKIRMKRIGAKNTPIYRIVVADGRSPRDGKFIEELGTYWPQKKSDKVKLNLDRAQYWIGKGAQPSDTVASFIKQAAKGAAATV